LQNLDRALEEAEAQIEADPEGGLAAPRPYPQLARDGVAWIEVKPYWIAYSHTDPPVILAVFYVTADMPGRYSSN
jgi:hypothetical protein